MFGKNTVTPVPQLTLPSRLDDLAQVWPWVEALSEHYAIPSNSQFAIQLCLEEALSNIIRHGYGEQQHCPITIHFAHVAIGDLEFTIEDHAPPFNPLAATTAEETAPPRTVDQSKVGGQGILLMRKFASSIAYQRLPDGNRLTLGFTFKK